MSRRQPRGPIASVRRSNSALRSGDVDVQQPVADFHLECDAGDVGVHRQPGEEHPGTADAFRRRLDFPHLLRQLHILMLRAVGKRDVFEVVRDVAQRLRLAVDFRRDVRSRNRDGLCGGVVHQKMQHEKPRRRRLLVLQAVLSHVHHHAGLIGGRFGRLRLAVGFRLAFPCGDVLIEAAVYLIHESRVDTPGGSDGDQGIRRRALVVSRISGAEIGDDRLRRAPRRRLHVRPLRPESAADAILSLSRKTEKSNAKRKLENAKCKLQIAKCKKRRTETALSPRPRFGGEG